MGACFSKGPPTSSPRGAQSPTAAAKAAAAKATEKSAAVIASLPNPADIAAAAEAEAEGKAAGVVDVVSPVTPDVFSPSASPPVLPDADTAASAGASTPAVSTASDAATAASEAPIAEPGSPAFPEAAVDALVEAEVVAPPMEEIDAEPQLPEVEMVSGPGKGTPASRRSSVVESADMFEEMSRTDVNDVKREIDSASLIKLPSANAAREAFAGDDGFVPSPAAAVGKVESPRMEIDRVNGNKPNVGQAGVADGNDELVFDRGVEEVGAIVEEDIVEEEEVVVVAPGVAAVPDVTATSEAVVTSEVVDDVPDLAPHVDDIDTPEAAGAADKGPEETVVADGTVEATKLPSEAVVEEEKEVEAEAEPAAAGFGAAAVAVAAGVGASVAGATGISSKPTPSAESGEAPPSVAGPFASQMGATRPVDSNKTSIAKLYSPYAQTYSMNAPTKSVLRSKKQDSGGAVSEKKINEAEAAKAAVQESMAQAEAEEKEAAAVAASAPKAIDSSASSAAVNSGDEADIAKLASRRSVFEKTANSDDVETRPARESSALPKSAAAAFSVEAIAPPSAEATRASAMIGPSAPIHRISEPAKVLMKPTRMSALSSSGASVTSASSGTSSYAASSSAPVVIQAPAKKDVRILNKLSMFNKEDEVVSSPKSAAPRSKFVIQDSGPRRAAKQSESESLQYGANISDAMSKKKSIATRSSDVDKIAAQQVESSSTDKPKDAEVVEEVSENLAQTAASAADAKMSKAVDVAPAKVAPELAADVVEAVEVASIPEAEIAVAEPAAEVPVV